MTIQGNLIITIIILVLIIMYSIKIKNIFNPILLFSFPVALGYILYFFFFQYVWKLSNTALLVYILGLIGFNLGYMLFSLIELHTYQSKIELSISKQYYHFEKNYFVISVYVLGIILNILSIKYLRGLGLTGSDLRDTFVLNAENMPFYVIYGKYILMFAIIALLDSALRHKVSKIYWIIIIIGISVALEGALLTQARTDVLIIFLPIMTLFAMIKGKNISYYKFFQYSLFTLCGIVFLYLMFKVIQVGRFGNDNSSFFSSSNQTFQYISLPLVAFDQWAVSSNYAGVMHGLGVFEPIDKILKITGYNFPTFNLATMGQFNVYGYYQAPFMAFGLVGTFIALIFVGAVSRWVYTHALSNQFCLLVYVFFVDGVMLSFYSWQFFNMVIFYAIIFYAITIFTSSRNNQPLKE